MHTNTNTRPRTSSSAAAARVRATYRRTPEVGMVEIDRSLPWETWQYDDERGKDASRDRR